ncbi:hypothetical protein pb186bvf_007311 [Paramecium bursaria]
MAQSNLSETQSIKSTTTSEEKTQNRRIDQKQMTQNYLRSAVSPKNQISDLEHKYEQYQKLKQLNKTPQDPQNTLIKEKDELIKRYEKQIDDYKQIIECLQQKITSVEYSLIENKNLQQLKLQNRRDQEIQTDDLQDQKIEINTLHKKYQELLKEFYDSQSQQRVQEGVILKLSEEIKRLNVDLQYRNSVATYNISPPKRSIQQQYDLDDIIQLKDNYDALKEKYQKLIETHSQLNKQLYEQKTLNKTQTKMIMDLQNKDRELGILQIKYMDMFDQFKLLETNFQEKSSKSKQLEIELFQQKNINIYLHEMLEKQNK